jgi:integrase
VRAPSPESPRERVLDDAELSAVWRAFLGLGHYGAIVRLLALTGQRRSEVAEMTWAELDLAGKVWNLPAARCKNGRSHSVPLSDAALAILEKNADQPQSFAIFAPISFSREKAVLDKLLPAEMPKWTLHDLRRTAASGMAARGVRIDVIEKVLDHQSGSFRGIVGVYQKHSFASEKRAALDLWAAHVAALVAPDLDLTAALTTHVVGLTEAA